MPEQSLVASPRAAIARRALRPTSTRLPPCLGLVAPPRSTPHRLAELERGEREMDRTRERFIWITNERTREEEEIRREEKKERQKEMKEKRENRLSAIYKLCCNYIN
jgi:hypothetical protein